PAEHTLKPADTASARTNSVALTLLPRAGRDAPLQLDADAVTRQLGFSALRESLDQVLERRLGLGLAPEPLLAQSHLVAGRGRTLAGRPALADLRVLDQSAVELRLREEAFPGPILGVVGKVGVRVSLEVIAIARERHGVAALRQVRGGLVIELGRVGP